MVNSQATFAKSDKAKVLANHTADSTGEVGSKAQMETNTSKIEATASKAASKHQAGDPNWDYKTIQSDEVFHHDYPRDDQWNAPMFKARQEIEKAVEADAKKDGAEDGDSSEEGMGGSDDKGKDGAG